MRKRREGGRLRKSPTPTRGVRTAMKKLTALLLAAAVAVSLGLAGGLPAAADTAPADPGNPATPATGSGDGFPTAQINGVAWAEVIIGTTVYVGGNSPRPARGCGAGTGRSPPTTSSPTIWRPERC